MDFERSKLRWNGWGWNEAPDTLGEKADAIWTWIGQALGVHPLPYTPARELAEIVLPPVRLSAAQLDALAALCASERVKTDDYERAFHARGKSYHDLLHLRAGHIDTAPDAVLYPESTEETVALVRYAAEHRIAVIPFGGGSSVVGGVTARPGAGHIGVITLDMTRMNRVLEIDAISMTARVEAGIYGPALEEALQAQGFTLGHYPQSFEFSTLGGWIAPRGAGQQSNKYGKAERWLVSATLATPQGRWDTEGFPGSAAGPQLRDLVAGSEGRLGVITEAVVKTHRAPECTDYRGYIFMDFAAGVEAARTMMQSGVPTAMIRLSDLDETYFYHALHTGGEADPGLRFCLMLLGLEGGADEVAAARARSMEIAEKHGGMHMGESLGEAWYKGRFSTPYLRDPMLDRGLGVDTLETAVSWSKLLPLHDTVTAAIHDAMAENAPSPEAKGIVMSHVSHSYRDGASLYFTFVFPRALGKDIEQWQAIKAAASEAILAHGGTISHHHGIGEDHRPWMTREKGAIGLELLQAAAQRIDPGAVLNPGKLLG